MTLDPKSLGHAGAFYVPKINPSDQMFENRIIIAGVEELLSSR
jgi:hypothetical protein